MKYRVSIDGQEHEVDVVVHPDGRVGASLDGVARADLDVVRVPGGVNLRIGARVFDLAAGGSPEATQVASGAARARAEVLSARARALSKRGGTLDHDDKDIRAPMPGRVVKVLVEVGQTIEAGAPCVVIEAMKMENELLAAAAGEVAEVLVSEGASVEGQALLVRLA